MTSVFLLKIYNNPDRKYFTVVGVYKKLEDALAEKDRLRTDLPERAFTFEWGVYCPRDLFDVVEYEVL